MTHVTIPIMLVSQKTLILGGIIGVDILLVIYQNDRHCTVIFYEFLVRPNRRYRKVTILDHALTRKYGW